MACVYTYKRKSKCQAIYNFYYGPYQILGCVGIIHNTQSKTD